MNPSSAKRSAAAVGVLFFGMTCALIAVIIDHLFISGG